MSVHFGISLHYVYKGVELSGTLHFVALVPGSYILNRVRMLPSYVAMTGRDIQVSSFDSYVVYASAHVLEFERPNPIDCNQYSFLLQGSDARALLSSTSSRHSSR